MNTLVQQMAATESLAAVDTICVDKTGTLTDGTLDLVSVEVADKAQPAAAHEALAPLRALGRGARTGPCETIAERYPGKPEQVVAEVPFSSAWKWSGVTLDGGGSPASYVLGAPDVLSAGGGARAVAARFSGASRSTPPPGGGWSPSARASARAPARSRPPAAAEARARAPWWCSRSSFGPTPPRRSSSCGASRST